MQGANNDLGTIYSQGLPNIIGSSAFTASNTFSEGTVITNGALKWNHYVNGSYGNTANNSGYYGYDIVFDASLSNSIYGNSNGVQPNSQTFNFIIKY